MAFAGSVFNPPATKKICTTLFISLFERLCVIYLLSLCVAEVLLFASYFRALPCLFLNQFEEFVSLKFQLHMIAGEIGAQEQGKVVDLMLVVEDAESFHHDNLKRNGRHYPLPLRCMGPKSVARLQTRWGARVYFNTLIPVDGGLIKYGVITRSALVADLLDWDWLYTSGRLHKPVLVLQSPWTADLRTALKKNLQSALHAVLLLLPDTFSEEKLYKTLTGLSYGGDFRMIFGEDKHKVDKIVGPHLHRFNQLYSPYFPALADRLLYSPSKGCLEQDSSPATRLFHLNLLPKTVQQELVNEWNKDGKYHDVEDVLRAAAHDTDCPELVQKALQRIVWRSSWSQSLKGIVTAGPLKSIRYSASKVNKMIKSLREKDKEKPKMLGN